MKGFTVTKNTKIILILVGLVVLFFMDYQMRRIGLLELNLKKLDVERRLNNLESISASRDEFAERLDSLEKAMDVAYQAYAQSNVLNSQFNFDDPVIDDDPLFDEWLNKIGVSVFRSKQTSEAIDDARIGGMPYQKDFNWGKYKYIDIGQGKDANIYRTLIKFDQLKPGLLEGGKIIGAVMYLMVCNNARDNDKVLHDVADVYAVKKEWNEGNKESNKAGNGEVSWTMASEGNVSWSAPGAGDPDGDIFADPIASSGPHINDHTDAWVPFYFNQNGIKHLQECVDNANNLCHGFLIMSRSEGKSSTHTTFWSSEYSVKKERPYLKIIYTVPR